MNSSVYSARRQQFVERLRARGEDIIAVFPSTPVHLRNNDVEHEYRQDSDLFYLTGFAEPETVAVISARDGSLTMFVRPRDPDRETWDGPRAGLDGARTEFGATTAFAFADLAHELPKLMRDHSRAVVRLGRDRTFDAAFFSALDRTRAFARTGASFPVELLDPAAFVHEMRLVKQEDEIAMMRRAAAITAEAHARAMAGACAGLREYHLDEMLLSTFRRHGSERAAYSSIVGSGPNATILHYRAGNRELQQGELVLIDAGCEYGYYASDVTRTFPVGGVFSAAQRAVYEVVLEAEEAGIALVKPGSTIDEIHRACVRILVQGMLRIGLMSGECDAIIADESYKAFYMHRTSHWLGMDVHDVGSYFEQGRPRPFVPGMVITVEPGIYVRGDDVRAPEKFRGIGIRIEDDILVTHGGHENLTAAIPKRVRDLQEACGKPTA